MKKDKNSAKFIENLFEEYVSAMWKYAYKIVRNEDSSDDVVQISFQHLIQNVDTLKKLNSIQLDAYITLTTKHTAYRYLKKESKYYIIPLEEIENKISCSNEMDSIIDKIFAQEQIQRLLNTLSEPYRDVIMFRYSFNLSYQEIAEIMGTTENYVGVLLYRAIKKLRENFSLEG